MSPEERVIVQRFAEAYLPTEGTNLKPLTEVPYLDNIDRRLSSFERMTIESVKQIDATVAMLFETTPSAIDSSLIIPRGRCGWVETRRRASSHPMVGATISTTCT